MRTYEFVTKIAGMTIVFLLAFGLLSACSQDTAPGKGVAVAAPDATPSAAPKTPAPDPQAQAAIAAVMEKGMSPNHLAGIHQKKLSLDCAACHGNDVVPNDTASTVNASCVTCHGDYDKMAATTKAKTKNPDINVHGSHLGPEIACSTCHQGHQESLAYCTYCHTNFNLPIPGGVATLQESKQTPQWKK